jgi:putative redox protein
MYANRKDWPLEDVRVRLAHVRDYDRDCSGCDEQPVRMEKLQRYIGFEGPLDASQRGRLLEIADRCPVHRTLEGHLRVETSGEDAG